MTPTTTPAQPEPNYEHARAIMEGERSDSLGIATTHGVIKQFMHGDASPAQIYETAFTNGWDRHAAQVAALTAAPGVQADLVLVKKEDANRYCEILTVLGMEEEGDPAAEIQRLQDRAELATVDVLSQLASARRPVTAEEHDVLMAATRDSMTLVAKGRLVDAAPAQPAEGAAYAELPQPALCSRKDPEYYDQLVYSETPRDPMFWKQYFTADDMRDFADRTHALRASNGQAPAGAAQEPTAFIHWPINGPPRLVWYSQKALNEAILKTYEGHQPDVKLYTAQPAPAAQVIIDFAQVGTAGPFPVVEGRVALTDATMQDLVRMLRPSIEELAAGAVVVPRAVYDALLAWRNPQGDSMATVRPLLTAIDDMLAAAPTPAAQQGDAREFPPLKPELASILGTMCFQCITFAQALRAAGHKINTRAEDEQAAVLHWMLGHYFRHGEEGWRKAADKDMLRMQGAALAQKEGK